MNNNFTMPFTITDNEFLSMPDKLREQLIEYLKKQRNDTLLAENTSSESNAETLIKDNQETDNFELDVNKRFEVPKANAVLEEVLKDGKYIGVRIAQNKRIYIARDWSLSNEVQNIINIAVDCGLTSFWRTGPSHPREISFYPNIEYIRGAHHIGLSFNTIQRYVFVLGAESRPKAKQIREITFHKRFENILKEVLAKEISSNEVIETGTWRKQNWGGKDLTTHPSDFEKIVKFMKEDRDINPHFYE